MTSALIVGVLWVIGLLSMVLAAFTLYLMAGRVRESRRNARIQHYLQRTTATWYEVLRGYSNDETELVPRNTSEVTAIEEVFKSFSSNVRGEGFEKKIQEFSNRNLVDHYRRKLNSRSWGERMNAMRSVYDLGIDRLGPECRNIAERPVTAEECFQLLLIDLKFSPATFLERNASQLAEISENEAKELFYQMPESLLEKAASLIRNGSLSNEYAFIDVIGMKREWSWRGYLEDSYLSDDAELRIRILRAFNTFGLLPSHAILENAAGSSAWPERYQAARLLRWMPVKAAAPIAERLADDDVFLIRSEVLPYLAKQTDGDLYLAEAAADETNPIASHQLSEEKERGKED